MDKQTINFSGKNQIANKNEKQPRIKVVIFTAIALFSKHGGTSGKSGKSGRSGKSGKYIIVVKIPRDSVCREFLKKDIMRNAVKHLLEVDKNNADC